MATLMKEVRKINECLLEQTAESKEPSLRKAVNEEHTPAVKEKTD